MGATRAFCSLVLLCVFLFSCLTCSVLAQVENMIWWLGPNGSPQWQTGRRTREAIRIASEPQTVFRTFTSGRTDGGVWTVIVATSSTGVWRWPMPSGSWPGAKLVNMQPTRILTLQRCPNAYGAQFLADESLLVVSCAGALLQSTDKGNSFTNVSFPPGTSSATQFQGVGCSVANNVTHIAAAVPALGIFHTQNGGGTWRLVWDAADYAYVNYRSIILYPSTQSMVVDTDAFALNVNLGHLGWQRQCRSRAEADIAVREDIVKKGIVKGTPVPIPVATETVVEGLTLTESSDDGSVVAQLMVDDSRLGDIWLTLAGGIPQKVNLAPMSSNDVDSEGLRFSAMAMDNAGQVIAAIDREKSVWKWTNVGRTWSRMINATSSICSSPTDVDVLNSGNTIVVTCRGAIVWSTNSGVTFANVVASGSNNQLQWQALTVDSGGRIAFAAAKSSGVWKTNNAGGSWTRVYSDTDASLDWTSIGLNNDGSSVVITTNAFLLLSNQFGNENSFVKQQIQTWTPPTGLEPVSISWVWSGFTNLTNAQTAAFSPDEGVFVSFSGNIPQFNLQVPNNLAVLAGVVWSPLYDRSNAFDLKIDSRTNTVAFSQTAEPSNSYTYCIQQLKGTPSNYSRYCCAGAGCNELDITTSCNNVNSANRDTVMQSGCFLQREGTSCFHDLDCIDGTFCSSPGPGILGRCTAQCLIGTRVRNVGSKFRVRIPIKNGQYVESGDAAILALNDWGYNKSPWDLVKGRVVYYAAGKGCTIKVTAERVNNGGVAYSRPIAIDGSQQETVADSMRNLFPSNIPTYLTRIGRVECQCGQQNSAFLETSHKSGRIKAARVQAHSDRTKLSFLQSRSFLQQQAYSDAGIQLSSRGQTSQNPSFAAPGASTNTRICTASGGDCARTRCCSDVNQGCIWNQLAKTFRCTSLSACTPTGGNCSATRCCTSRTDACFPTPSTVASPLADWKPTTWTCAGRPSASLACARTGEDCSASKCCLNEGDDCFQQGRNNARCFPREPACPFANLRNPPTNSTLACTRLQTDATNVTPVASYGNCLNARRCRDGQAVCWQQNAWYAQCIPVCPDANTACYSIENTGLLRVDVPSSPGFSAPATGSQS